MKYTTDKYIRIIYIRVNVESCHIYIYITVFNKKFKSVIRI